MTVQDLIRFLDVELESTALEALDDAALGKLEGLLYHWQSLCDGALAYRRKGAKDEASE